MVTEHSQDLDEMILQIFEEQEDQFYFPVTSQSTAKNFVKALHAKGLPYEAVYKEIDEFEHNFNAWKKGLGRVGIGNRIIERINQPLEEVLKSDDEDDLKEILTRIKKKDSRSDRPKNDRVPPIPKPDLTAEETRIEKLKENIQKQENGGVQMRHQDSPKSSRKGTSDSSSRASTGSPYSSARSSPSRLPGAELDQVEPGLVDFRSVLRNSPAGSKEGSPVPRDRRSMPPALEVTSASGMTKKINGETDKLKNDNNNTKKKAVVETIKKEATTKTKSAAPLAAHEDSDESDEDLSDEDLDSSCSSITSSEELSEDEEEQKKEPKVEQNFFKVEQKPGSPTKAPIKVVIKAEEKVEKKPAKVEEKPAEVEEKPAKVEEKPAKVEEKTVKVEEKPAKVEEKTAKVEEKPSEEEEGLSEVVETYDSDLDENCQDLSKEALEIVKKFAMLKKKLSIPDGPGYLYIFSDSDKMSGTTLLKVGATRFPKKQLKKSRCFNLKMRQIHLSEVSQRKKAMMRLEIKLRRFEMKDHPNWYEGPLKDIKEAIEATAKHYEINDSQC